MYAWRHTHTRSRNGFFCGRAKNFNPSRTRKKKRSTSFPRKKDNLTQEDAFSKKAVKDKKASPLPDGESNPGLPRDRRGYSPLYYRGLLTNLVLYSSPNFLDQTPIFASPMMLQEFRSKFLFRDELGNEITGKEEEEEGEVECSYNILSPHTLNPLLSYPGDEHNDGVNFRSLPLLAEWAFL